MNVLAVKDEDLPSNPPSAAQPLTQWKNAPTVANLNADLEASRPAHDNFVLKVKHWKNLMEVTGDQKPKQVKGRSQVQPKLIRRQAEWRYSALTEPFNSSDKVFDISPVTFEDADAARQNELLLNWQFRTKLNRVDFVDNYVRANVDEGTAIVRVGWCRYTKTVEEDAPVWEYLEAQDPTHVQQLEAANLLKQQDPRRYAETVPPEIQKALEFFDETGQVTVARQNGTQKVPVEKVIQNHPTLNVINIENFYFDPTCGSDLDKAGFVIISFETSKSDLMKEPNRYKNLDVVPWDTATTVLEPNHAPSGIDTNFNFKDPARRRVVAYEYWGEYDIHGTGELVPIVATWIGNVLIRLELNPFPDQKHPFVVAPYMPVKRQLLGEPDAELLEDNQKILGATTRGMIDLLGRSANSQRGFAKGMLDVVNRRRYDDGQDYEYNPQANPQHQIVEHTYPEIPQSAMLMVTLMNQEAEALTGVKAFSGGLSGNAYGDVAAGIKGILDAASKREMAILRRLAAGLKKIGEKITAMNAVFLSEEEIIRVTNTDFVTIKREDLPGNFDLKIDISTPEVDASKSQDLAFMLQTLGNSMDFGVTKIILLEIARLKRMPELAQQIKQFEPKPDPMQQKLMELEIQVKQAELMKLQSETQLNQAKARKEMVEAEQGALDTVEQETGTKHARDMQKQGAQGAANQELEITKSLLKPRKVEESRPDVEAAIGWGELSKRSSDPIQPSPINNIIPT